MKNKITIRTVILFLTCIALGVLFVKNGLESKQVQKSQVEQIATKPTVTVSVNNGISLLTESIAATTPFEALSIIAKNNTIVLTTKQYDFGVFVSGIGGVMTTSEYGWIYYVNGVSGSVAADKQELKQNDSIEWKYEKSIF